MIALALQKQLVAEQKAKKKLTSGLTSHIVQLYRGTASFFRSCADICKDFPKEPEELFASLWYTCSCRAMRHTIIDLLYCVCVCVQLQVRCHLLLA